MITHAEKEKQTIKPLASVSMNSCGLIVLVLALAWCQAPQWGKQAKKKGSNGKNVGRFFSPFSPTAEPGSRLSQPLSEREAEVDLVLTQTSSLFLCKFCLKNTSQHKNNTIYIIHSFFIYKNVVFPAQAEYSYFSADFRLKIFLYYS